MKLKLEKVTNQPHCQNKYTENTIEARIQNSRQNIPK